ncbi:glycosyltransferase family 2 protein [Bacteroides fluxus]|nr:glycosyltransferase family 2 protein [Bacteroides fluxus]
MNSETKEIKISFIVPVYNMEKYLHKSMDSMCGQTMKEIEIICVNDCSTDSTLSILREYEAKDSRVRIIDLSRNLKQGGARNRALDVAQGEFISFVDPDDWIDIHLAEHMYKAAMEQDADMVRGGVKLYFSEQDQRHESTGGESLDLPDDERRRHHITDGGHLAGGIIRRKVVEEHKLRFPEELFYEDNAVGVLFWLYCRKIVVVDGHYYYYRQNNVSTTRCTNNYRQFDRLVTAKMFLENMKQHGFYEAYSEECDFYFMKLFYFNTCSTAIFSFDPPALEYIMGPYKELKGLIPNFRKNRYYKKCIPSFYRLCFGWLVGINVHLAVACVKLRAGLGGMVHKLLK